MSHLQRMDIREVVAAPVHRDLLLPVVESPGDVDLATPVLPSKYRGHQLFGFDENTHTRTQRERERER